MVHWPHILHIMYRNISEMANQSQSVHSRMHYVICLVAWEVRFGKTNFIWKYFDHFINLFSYSMTFYWTVVNCKGGQHPVTISAKYVGIGGWQLRVTTMHTWVDITVLEATIWYVESTTNTEWLWFGSHGVQSCTPT